MSEITASAAPPLPAAAEKLKFYGLWAGAAIALLLLPMLPVIGLQINGARVWIGIGPFTFQPGETFQTVTIPVLNDPTNNGQLIANLALVTGTTSCGPATHPISGSTPAVPTWNGPGSGTR